jgi:hypothetical protein
LSLNYCTVYEAGTATKQESWRNGSASLQSLPSRLQQCVVNEEADLPGGAVRAVKILPIDIDRDNLPGTTIWVGMHSETPPNKLILHDRFSRFDREVLPIDAEKQNTPRVIADFQFGNSIAVTDTRNETNQNQRNHRNLEEFHNAYSSMSRRANPRRPVLMPPSLLKTVTLWQSRSQ